MKKRLTLMISLLAVFLCLTVVYVIISNSNAALTETTAPTTEDDTIILASFDVTNMTRLKYKTETSELVFIKKTDAWYLESDERFPLDTTTVASMATAISSIGANRYIGNDASAFADFGLDTPLYTITAEYSDGTSCVYLIGDYNSFNGSNYFNIKGSNEIYMIYNALTSYFDYTLEELAVLDSVPTVDAEKNVGWRLTTSAGTKETMDFDATSEIFNLYSAISLKTYAEYYADEAKMTEYGLSIDKRKVLSALIDETETDESGESKLDDLLNTDESKTPTETEYTEISVYFGNTDGDVIYLTVDGSTIVYKVSADTFAQIYALFEQGE